MRKAKPMLSCKEVSWIVSSGKIEHIHGFRRFSIWMHHWMCHPCRIYKKQIQKIGQAARDWSYRSTIETKLTSIKEKILKGLIKGRR